MFAMGHLTSFLHISNKLAERGHRISFFLPNKTQAKLESFNLHKDLISFIPIIVPHVDGLPPGAETTADVPFPLLSLLMTAMDLTAPSIEASLRDLKPHFVFYDFTHWLPAISPASIGFLLSPERKLNEKPLTAADYKEPPPCFPPSSIKLLPFETRHLSFSAVKQFGSDISFTERQIMSFNNSDAISFRACMEMEGPYCDYVEEQFKKPVILTGPVVPKPPTIELEEKWTKGVVHGDWVQQQLILSHPSVGCFVTHCGSGSLSEALVTECQLVLLPHAGDQIINARLMGGDLKVGVEVEKGEEDGLFTREGVCKAVKAVMDDDSEVGKEVRANHTKWREFLSSKGLENSYIDNFVQKLYTLLK
ncbi:udp-glycosyltransferase 79b30 [Quercus suber]|uniref:Udp-glycosyltransferase 79b30 n=1 Tax=Quercus suber TaxID=58331 RepID=A0AAW0M085_QUESU